MDHHCLLLNKCVGRGTQRLFVLFLLICAVNMVTFVMLSTWYLYTEFSIFIVDARDIVVAIFNYYVFVWTMLLGNAVSLGWCMGMLMTQMWMISNGYLIATMSNVHTKLTYRQCINNLIAFALGNRVERNAYEAWPGKPYGIAPVWYISVLVLGGLHFLCFHRWLCFATVTSKTLQSLVHFLTS